jgi:hypothetical protein
MPSVPTANHQPQTPVKKKTVKRKVGTSIRALDKDISFAGWTGKVVEVSGKKSPFKYFVEWDDSVVDSMPESYVKRCEDQQIYHKWACLTDTDFEAIE